MYTYLGAAKGEGVLSGARRELRALLRYAVERVGLVPIWPSDEFFVQETCIYFASCPTLRAAARLQLALILSLLETLPALCSP